MSTARFCGRPRDFTLAVAVIAVWLLTGPIFAFSDTWQLVIDTGTTIITFLMVFLIQNTQNRDTEAIQVKLDELIRATQGAHNALLDLEELEEEKLDAFRARYQALAAAARADQGRGNQDTGTPEPRAAAGRVESAGRRMRRRPAAELVGLTSRSDRPGIAPGIVTMSTVQVIATPCRKSPLGQSCSAGLSPALATLRRCTLAHCCVRSAGVRGRQPRLRRLAIRQVCSS